MSALSRAEIEALIPHRDPFLWIDEVVEITESRIVARKLVTEELELFRGHYPDFPVLPGVIQCEMCFQAGAILIARRFPLAEGQVPVVTRINNVKFRQMVRPGTTVDITAELTETLSNAWFLNGNVTANGKTTARLEFACTAATVTN